MQLKYNARLERNTDPTVQRYPYLDVPSSASDAINNVLGSHPGVFWDCAHAHNLTFQIGGKLFPLDLRDFYSNDGRNATECTSIIQEPALSPSGSHVRPSRRCQPPRTMPSVIRRAFQLVPARFPPLPFPHLLLRDSRALHVQPMSGVIRQAFQHRWSVLEAAGTSTLLITTNTTRSDDA